MLPWRVRNFRKTSSSKRSTSAALRARTRSRTWRIRASPPGSKKRVMTRRISLVKVTGRRRTFKEFRPPLWFVDRAILHQRKERDWGNHDNAAKWMKHQEV